VVFPAGSVTGVSDTATDRMAVTSVPLHPPIAARWSPRAFDPVADLGPDDLTALLEAARWAPTWGRRQPVRFVVGRRGEQDFATLADLLKRGNQYARAASALILLCADQGPDENTALYSGVDAGAALANLSVEAVARGLIVHPMAGFDTERAAEVFTLPDELRPLMVIAVGRLGDYGDVDPEIAERDRLPRERMPLSEVVLNWA
jgi:nitroreductase